MTSSDAGFDPRVLLPFFVNGTLSHEETKRMQDELDVNPELAAEHKALARIRTTWQSEADPDGEGSPGEDGLRRLMATIDQIEGPIPASIVVPEPANTNRPIFSRVATLAAAAVFGALVMSAWNGFNEDIQGAEMASSSAFDSYDGPLITVRFKESATVSEINSVLRDEGLVIVDGPSAARLYRLGAFDLKLTSDDAETLRNRDDVFELVADPE